MKLLHLLTGLCVVTAMSLIPVSVAVAASQPADPDNPCAGKGTGIFWENIQTTPSKANEPAGLSGGAALCGGDASKDNGWIDGEIAFPNSAKSRCANPYYEYACTSESDLKEGQYIGKVDMAISVAGLTFTAKDPVESRVYVGKAPVIGLAQAMGEKQQKNDLCTSDAIACYQGVDTYGAGVADMAVVKKTWTNSKGKVFDFGYSLKIGKIKPFPFMGAGAKGYYLQIGSSYAGDDNAMELCRYAGSVDGNDCGSDPNQWINKNGDAGKYVCNKLMFGLVGSDVKGIGYVVSASNNIPAPKVDPNSRSRYSHVLRLGNILKNKFSINNCSPISWS